MSDPLPQNHYQSVQQHQASQPKQAETHQCKECGLFLNSTESLDVHTQYHKENLLSKWAAQAAAAATEETNNNTKSNMKREFVSSTVAPADNSDSMMKKSPEYGSRATPDTSVNFGHPPTPQSYHSASSPYQTPNDSTAFSPGYQGYQNVKQERASPTSQFQQHQNFGFNATENNYYNVESPTIQAQQNYQQDFLMHKMNMQNSSFRYQPYSRPYDHNQVTGTSPSNYPAQPTPSPSPKQCDKCGFVCDSASQLIEHLNVAHPPTPYQQNQFMFPSEIKTEEENQSEILDLDSHKVHQVFQEEEKRANGELNGTNPHSVTTMLGGWPQPPNQQKMFGQDHRMFQNGMGNPMGDNKMYGNQMQQMHSPDFMGNPMGNGGHDGMPPQQMPYRPFEHLPQSAPVISSTQVAPPSAPAPVQKSANWKSNEARRPKTYNCTACNKWFTSSGHLKRHYNTTLHKNAVKSSGQPDPATLPISAHHHPARDSNSNREDPSSSSPTDEARGDDSLSSGLPGGMPNSFDRSGPMGGLLQQPPNGPYDRQSAPNLGLGHHPPNLQPPHPPSLHHPPLHSPMGGLPPAMSSPPNGEAGPSVTANMDSRGLLSTAINSNGFMMAGMNHPQSTQFQMYPNESAPHVTQLMDTTTSSPPSTTGEGMLQQEPLSGRCPLPSFAQIQAGRMNIVDFGDANVGGMGPVTGPYYYPANNDTQVDTDDNLFIKLQKVEDDDGNVVSSDGLEGMDPYSPPNHNNNLGEYVLLDDKYLVELNHPKDMYISTTTNLPQLQPLSPPENNNIHKPNYEAATSPSGVSSTTNSTIQLQQQLNKQHGVHKCYDCDKTFMKSCYLTQHNKTFHDGDKPFKCGRCGKRFACDSQYKQHQNKHNGDKPHKCEQCPKQFNHKTDLRRHMCLHSGQKPYTCEQCGKGFIRKDHMLKHYETHQRRPSKVTAMR